MNRKKRDKMNKMGLSEMISYVLLISIAIGISVGVFAWMKSYAVNPASVECKEGTSVTIQNYECFPNPEGGIRLIIKNNGRFNVSGIIVVAGNNSEREPGYYLKLSNRQLWNLQEGYYFFTNPLKPGTEETVEFSNNYSSGGVIKSIDSIKIIRIQLFVINEKRARVFCQNSIKQPIEDCDFN